MAAEVAADLGAGGRVEGGQGLVQQQQPRLPDHGPGQRDPLGLAAGQARAWAPAWAARPTRSSQAAARRRASARPRPRARSPKATFSSADRCGKSR